MSSGFVSGGTIEAPTERDDEWLTAHRELEAERRRKAEASNRDDGKSLYEILQQNKAAKQEAFEESIKLKNQFRSLDEDEVEFLDSVLESTRAQEAALKRETREQLEIFHRQRQEAEKALVGASSGNPSAVAASPPDEEQWMITGRKRRRTKEKDAFPGVKLRKSSSADVNPITTSKIPSDSASEQSQLTSGSAEISKTVEQLEEPVKPENAEAPEEPETTKPHPSKSKEDTAPHAVSSALGLGAYSSDDD
ncbi:hypothetical protein AJ78_03816 [Emergomyces pasteurianus Ep9510]|uniref:FAM192A/Fyv6 N-terminal domain-containing protein n=1 Tax=Emergomyces pasteurianus Ep9510 TaxID=1447872 RepID=A0A1J9PHR2_9EURO|nr:hypothetical protein AJ78_03816 [Emergomyces pasteurianus Ep9510]